MDTTEYGALVGAVLDTLHDVGPQTVAEIAKYIGVERSLLRSVISRMNRTWPRNPKRIYIYDWVHDAEGHRNYPRAVYALMRPGCEDKKKPKPKSDGERTKATYRRKKALTLNSVWALGTKVRDRIVNGPKSPF